MRRCRHLCDLIAHNQGEDVTDDDESEPRGQGETRPKKEKASNKSSRARKPETYFRARLAVDRCNRRDGSVLDTFDCGSVIKNSDIGEIVYFIEGIFELFDDNLAKQQAIQLSEMLLKAFGKMTPK
jgi:hypothetical protein